jgi:hypothetical protein
VSGQAKIKKNEQDHELNLKKIEKAKLSEKECANDIDKKAEEIRVATLNLKKIADGIQVEDHASVFKTQLSHCNIAAKKKRVHDEIKRNTKLLAEG